MRTPFVAKDFLTCPQGPRLVGQARVRACRLLDMAIMQGRVLLAARLLTRDPSLITESIGTQESEHLPAVQKAINAEMNILVLFALEHGVHVNDPSFGDSDGLLSVAIHRNSPGLTSCALLYTTEQNQIIWEDGEGVLFHAQYRYGNIDRTKGAQILLMLLDAGGIPPIAVEAGVFRVLERLNPNIQQQYRDQAASESMNGFSVNQAPKGFLGMKQGPRATGAERDKLRKLLEMAITQGRLVTATKILAKDPSLITETLGDAGHQQMPAMAMAVIAGMESLVPFALAQGVPPSAAIHADVSDNDSALLNIEAPRGLLDAAKRLNAPSLASHALLYRADPNQRNGVDIDGRPVTDLPPLLTNTLWNVSELASCKSLRLAQMLLGAKINLDASSHVAQAVSVLLSRTGGIWPEVQFRQVLTTIFRRGGIACANMRINGLPVIRYAAEVRNIYAVKLLIAAGANIDSGFLGTDLFTILKEKGQEKHIPALSELIIRQQSVRSAQNSLNPSVAPTDEPGATKLRTRKLTAIDVF